MKKIVEYDSKMNELSFGKFKEKELDIFFSICYKMKNEKSSEVVLSFQELKALSKYTDRNLERFVKDLRAVYKKLLNITMEIENEKYIEGFTLFTSYQVRKNEREISIKINEDYRYVLHDIGKFTKFDLIEFVGLKSSYAKNMFKILKQFDKENKDNWYQIDLDRFKELLGVPNSYKMTHITSFVLTPIKEQLTPYFRGLKIEKIKKGVKVIALKFTWNNRREKKEENSIPIKIKTSLGEKELQKHEENLKNSIEIIAPDPVVKLIKITKKDYEDLYRNYLEELGEEHNQFIRKSFDFINKTKYEITEDNKQDYIQIKIYTIEDIDESLLVSKTGKKLVGNARNIKAQKLLDELNKNGSV